jgi:Na+-driven multidrug efflux pump
MIIVMTVQTLYNLINRIRVSSLGTDAVAAVGFASPLLFMGTAIATGLGVGGGSAISRKIGAKDKKGGDIAAVHTLILMIIVALVYAIPLFVFAEDIFRIIGAKQESELLHSMYASCIPQPSPGSLLRSLPLYFDPKAMQNDPCLP